MQKKLVVSALLLIGFIPGACQSKKHTVARTENGTVIACSECYNEVYKLRHPATSRSGSTTELTQTRHACASCKAEASIYTENGVAKIRCAKCAPEGVPCDQCLPPEGWTPRAGR